MTVALADNRTTDEYRPFSPATNNVLVIPRELVFPDVQSFPLPGSPAWGYMNEKRARLIRKKVRGTLAPDESEELELLQRESLAIVDRLFPRPPVDLRALQQLQQQLDKKAQGKS